MTITRKDGLLIEPMGLIESLKGTWALYSCVYWKADWPEPLEGEIEGDGHMFAEETLRDEFGAKVHACPACGSFSNGKRHVNSPPAHTETDWSQCDECDHQWGHQ